MLGGGSPRMSLIQIHQNRISGPNNRESKRFLQKKFKKMLFLKRKFANLRSTFVPHMCSRKSREAVKIVESCQLY